MTPISLLLPVVLLWFRWQRVSLPAGRGRVVTCKLLLTAPPRNHHVRRLDAGADGRRHRPTTPIYHQRDARRRTNDRDRARVRPGSRRRSVEPPRGGCAA